MAKRRKLEAPSAEALAEIEAELSRAPAPSRVGTAPIAQVAAEVAAVRPAEDHAVQLTRLRDSADAEAWRQADEEGRVVLRLPVSAIDLDHVVRDRMASDPEEMAELKASLRASGQRLPVEVVALAEGRFGLISGWRRIAALAELAEEVGEAEPQVLALVRDGREAGAIYAGMVEENELRAALTPYERGRIAAVAAGQGAFASVDAAVDAIFAAASKSKRSKIRGFALVHEVLGDLLAHPAALGEKQGLALAQALRDGQGDRLRAALAAAERSDGRAEWRVLEQAMAAPQPAPQKGGRPRLVPEIRRERLPSGGALEFGWSTEGLVLKASGVTLPEAEFLRLIERLREAG
jgi:ParB family chromosome partitioning protein